MLWTPVMRSKVGRIVIGLTVSAGLLTLVISSLDLETAAARLKDLDWRWFIAALAAAVAVLIARSVRFEMLCERSPLRVMVPSIAMQNFFNRVTPLRLGELSLPYLLHRTVGEQPAKSLISLLLVRLVELWVLLSLMAAGLAWFGTGDSALVIAGLLLVLMTIALVYFHAFLALGIRLFELMVKKLGLDKFELIKKVQIQLIRVTEAEHTLDAKRRLALSVGTVLVLGLQLLLYNAVLRACGLNLDWHQVIVGSTAAQVVGALPVISVGSVGTHETGWIAGFVWVGVGWSDAVLTGLVSQVVSIVFAALFALPAWLWLMQHRDVTEVSDAG